MGNNGTFKGTDEPSWGQLSSGLWYLDFDGSDDKVTVGDTNEDIKTFACWISADDITTRALIDFDSGTHSVEINGSSTITATGWSSPTIYVDGQSASAIVTTGWHFVVVTTANAFKASSLVLGNEASFYDGKMCKIRCWQHALDSAQIKRLYTAERRLFS
jgi:hypothetical protein